jgi:hypothetical protein
MTQKIDPNLEAVEKGLAQMLPAAKSFAPPEQRGIHELIEELVELVDLTQTKLHIIRRRLDEFNILQSQFYNGRQK